MIERSVRVHYIHNGDYYVSRTFETMEKAQEFIDANAMVYALPGVYVTVLRDGKWVKVDS